MNVLEKSKTKIYDEPPDEIVLFIKSVFDGAKRTELDIWKKFDVYKSVKDDGQDRVSTRWVLTIKDNGIAKARLVARGFEDEELEPKDKQSPTCCKESIRLIICVSVMYTWKMESIHIKIAFLQGDMSSRNVYIKPPKEAETNYLWLVQKGVYGLSDASLKWYEKVRDVVLKLGCTVSKNDSPFYLLTGRGSTWYYCSSCRRIYLDRR